MEQWISVFECLPITFALAGILLLAQPAASQTTPEVSVFALPEQGGQILSLTTDDDGRLFAAATERAFGRGTVSVLENPTMAAQDRAVRSIAAREQLVMGWLGSGKLAPLIARQASFYQSAGDGPSNFLTKYSESVLWLTDVNRDGKAESAMGVAGAFRDSMDGPGSTLLALANGRWLYGCSPQVWKLADRNDDQRAEERSPLAEGFGLSNDPPGAGLEALLEAPDGWIYWAMGERGYALRQANGQMVRGIGSGAIFRCRANGSGVERIAKGLRNPRGLAMRQDGQLLAVDAAALGGKTRLLLILPGADYGWQAGAITELGEGLWFEENMEFTSLGQEPNVDCPQWLLPPLSLLETPCSALKILPEGRLLLADPQEGGKGGLATWNLEETGKHYQMKKLQQLWQGGAVMALTDSPDDSFYFADWGDRVNATSRVQVRRLTWPHVPPSASTPKVVQETAMTLIKHLPELRVKELKELLEHPTPRVALRARQCLEAMSFQDSLEALLQVARRGPTLTARLHGLRGAGAVARQEPSLLNELTAFLSDPDPALRATAATLLGEGSLTFAQLPLRHALTDEARPVRLAAAAALARLKPADLLADLLKAAAQNTTHDALIRSSLAHALAETVPSPAVAAATLSHPDTEVRLTAVLALRQLAGPEIADFLTDSDAVVVTEAARAIYDLPLRSAFPRLANLLVKSTSGKPALRRSLAAAAYLGTAADAERIASFAVAQDTAPALRFNALQALGTWDQPPALDPLWQRPETALPRLPGVARAAARTAAEALRNHPDPKIASAAQALWKTTDPGSSATRLATISRPEASEPERLAALRMLIAGNELSSDTAKILISQDNTTIPVSLRTEARALLMRRDPKNAALLVNEVLATGSILEKQSAIHTLDHLPGNGVENEKLLLELAKRLSLANIEDGLQVEVLEALQRRDTESRSPWRRATEAWLASLSLNLDPLAPWQMTLENGDAATGRVIFETSPEAGCLSCHSLDGLGGLTGPDLDGVSDRLTSNGLLESLIHPCAKIVKGYERYLEPISTSEGDQQNASQMPPMGTILTLRELRDLIAYLQTLKEPKNR